MEGCCRRRRRRASIALGQTTGQATAQTRRNKRRLLGIVKLEATMTVDEIDDRKRCGHHPGTISSDAAANLYTDSLTASRTVRASLLQIALRRTAEKPVRSPGREPRWARRRDAWRSSCGLCRRRRGCKEAQDPIIGGDQRNPEHQRDRQADPFAEALIAKIEVEGVANVRLARADGVTRRARGRLPTRAPMASDEMPSDARRGRRQG